MTGKEYLNKYFPWVVVLVLFLAFIIWVGH